MKAAAQVGLFVIVALVLFAAGFAVIGRGLFKPKSDVYFVRMPDAGGLAKGARVLMAGVQVGDVTNVTLEGPTSAKLEIALAPHTRLPLSTRALISGSLVGLGDTPLTLVQDAKYAGAGGDYSPGATIPGGKAGPLDSILPDGGTELYTQLNETLKSVRTLLQNDGIQKDVRSVLKTTQATMETSQNTLRAFTALAQRGDRVLAQNQDELAAIVRATDRTLVSVANTAETLERYARSGKLQKGLDATLGDVHDLAVQSKALLADLRRTVNDEGLNRDLRSTLNNVSTATEKLPALADNANKVAANMADLTEKSGDLPGKLGTVLDKAADLEERLGGLVDRFGGVLGSKPKGFPPITAQIDLLRESNPGYWRTDLNLSVPLSDGFLTAGLWDAFGRNRVNLQVGKNVSSSLDYRYGIYGGQPGIGVDYRLAPKLSFRGDLWDINDPRFDARLRYELGSGLIGWLGVDRLFQNPAATIGIGIRR